MRIAELRKRFLTVPVTVLAACVVSVGVAGAALATQKADGAARRGAQARPGCIVLNMIERTPRWYGNKKVDPRNVPVGFKAIYFDDVYDSAGHKKIGDAAGVNHAIGKRPSDGHMVQYVTQQFQLPDGDLVAEGAMDRSAVIAQHWVSTRIKGLTGRYVGMSGTWSWRLTDLTQPQMPLEEKIVLCRLGH